MKCESCGIEIQRMSPRQKYCKKCAYEIKLKKDRERIQRQRNLGTSNISSHKHKEIQREYNDIQNEVKKQKNIIRKCKNCDCFISAWKYINCDYVMGEMSCKKCGLVIGSIKGTADNPVYVFFEEAFEVVKLS